MTFIDNLFGGKTAIVTGGGTGIGAGIAMAIAGLGARVVAAGLDVNGFSPPAGLDIACRRLDVTDVAAVAALMDALPDIDIVVNCAGLIRRHKEHDVDVFAHVLDVNLTGTMRVCAAAREKLAARKGCIINMASMLSFFGGGLVPAYSASKGGVMQLTKSLAIAYAADGIRVNAVAPGWIATPLTQELQDDPSRSGPILSRTPLGRWGTPDDVAKVVVFLCSPAAAFMTGAIVPVDGGYLVS
jgi:NAD(P)-dependent dehydrogenase (short-subunit alcohol dehydrogenase family)